MPDLKTGALRLQLYGEDLSDLFRTESALNRPFGKGPQVHQDKIYKWD
jgi:hypothetical protein